MPSVLNTVSAAGAGTSPMTDATRTVFSSELWFAALPVLKFDQFATRKTELGAQAGRTISMPKMGAIKRGSRLVEAQRLQTRAMSMSSTTITVGEVGNAVGFSEFLLNTSFYDQMMAASLLLGRDMAVVLDSQLRDAAASTPNVIYANGRSSRAAIQSSDFFSVEEIRLAVEALSTANAPMVGGDHYVCMTHVHCTAHLQRDSDWISAALYSGASAIYTGEVGRWQNVRFVASTVLPNGANNAVDVNTGDYVDIGYDERLRVGVAGNRTNIYVSLFFGEYSYAHATALPVELRDSGNVDYGREYGIAWYAIWGEGLLDSANIIAVESA